MPHRVLEYQPTDVARAQIAGRGRHVLNVALTAPELVVGFAALMWFVSRDSMRAWSALALFGLQVVWIVIVVKGAAAWFEGGRSRMFGLCAVGLTTMWIFAVGVFTFFHK